MSTFLSRYSRQANLLLWLAIAMVLTLAYLLGRQASIFWLGLLIAVIGGLVLLAQPVLGLLALVLATLVVSPAIPTGTEVKLNTTSLMVPALLLIWLLDMVRRRRIGMITSAANQPLALFLLAGLLSLLIGRATWDPLVPVGGNFLLVQLAQWAIFVFSAGAFWLTANLITTELWLRRLTALFLLIGGSVAVLIAAPGLGKLIYSLTPVTFIRAPFWVLLTALAAGQLIFNQRLAISWRAFHAIVVASSLVYALLQQQEAASNWVGLATVLGTLAWLRYPRLRWPAFVLILALAAVGVLFPTMYEFAGGDAEWQLSGGSRLVLMERVIEVTMRNPVTGLGPAAYRPYANTEPLSYAGAFWVAPRVNSHNNYVDLFAHTGIVGVVMFLWFAVEIARLGARLRKRFTDGFCAGYLNGVLASGAGALVIMALADWILPFVYNIGFEGFPASVLIWLFLGGLVTLEHLPDPSIVGASR